jgi:hypothetical protein
MKEDKDFDSLVSSLFREISHQLKSKKRLVGAAVGACIFDEDVVVMRICGDNTLWLVDSVDKDNKEFFFTALVRDNNNVERYIGELLPLLGNADGVKPGTIQSWRGFE